MWEVANYYKHCDEWGSEEWSNEELGPKLSKKERQRIAQRRRTRSIVEELGITRSFAASDVHTAYEFFGIDWASDCTPLVHQVQKWAKAVYDKCKTT